MLNNRRITKKGMMALLLGIAPFLLTGCTIESFGRFPLILILLIPAALVTYWIFKYTYIKLKRKGFFYWVKRYLLLMKEEDEWYGKIREAVAFKKTLIEKNKAAASGLAQMYSGSKFCAAYFRKDSKEYSIVDRLLKNIIGKKDPKKPGIFRRFFGIKTLIAFNADMRSILGRIESLTPFAKSKEVKANSAEERAQYNEMYNNFYKEFKIEEGMFRNMLSHLENVVKKHSSKDLEWLQKHKKELQALEGEFMDAEEIGKQEARHREIKEKRKELNKMIERMETSDVEEGGIFPAIRDLILQRKMLNDKLNNFVLIIEKETKVLEKERDLLEDIEKLSTKDAKERKVVDQHLQNIDKCARAAEELYHMEVREFGIFWSKSEKGKDFNDYLAKIVVQEAKRRRGIVQEMLGIIGERLEESKNVYTIANFDDREGFTRHRARIEELLSRISYQLNDPTVKRIYETKVKDRNEDDAIRGLNECLDYIIKKGKKG